MVQNKLKELEDIFNSISKNLNILFIKENSFRLNKNLCEDQIVYFFLLTKDKKNTIYENLNDIKTDLNIRELPKLKKNSFIVNFIYIYDFKTNIYEIYLMYINPNDVEKIKNIKKLELHKIKLKSVIFKNKEIIHKKHITKKMTSNIFNKYKILKPYNKIFYYKNFDFYTIEKINDKIVAIRIIYDIHITLNDLEDFLFKLCEHLNWNKENLTQYISKNNNNSLQYIKNILFEKNSLIITYFKIDI